MRRVRARVSPRFYFVVWCVVWSRNVGFGVSLAAGKLVNRALGAYLHGPRRVRAPYLTGHSLLCNGGEIGFVCLIAAMLSRGGIAVIKFTASRKQPRYLSNYCRYSLPFTMTVAGQRGLEGP